MGKTTLILFIMTLIGCTKKIYVTPNALREWKSQGVNVKRIQLRNDSRIEWTKRGQENNVALKSGGNLRLSSEKMIVKTYIKKGTPCVIKSFPDTLSKGVYEFIYVSFDDDEAPFYFNTFQANKPYSFEWKGQVISKLYVRSTDIKKISLQRKRLKGVRVD